MTNEPMDLDYLGHLRADGERLAAIVESGPLDTPIAACPGWDLRQLGVHIGTIHRWAADALATGTAPERGGRDAPTGDGSQLAAWMLASLTTLIGQLDGLDLDAPTWHPFPVPQVARVWTRRQAQETMLHRWDAEHAVGRVPVLDARMASDGIDEYFEVMLPRLMVRQTLTPPEVSLHVHCTDVDGEWLVRSENGQLVMTREHAKGDAALRGPAEGLLLRLWGRPVADRTVDIVGDPDAAAAWLAIGGN